jgi:hypothetical protein
VSFHPRQQRGAKVEADLRIVVDYIYDAFIRSQDTRNRVRAITLCGDSFVPVMIRISRILKLDFFKPGILARWLIKVTVNANVAVHLFVSMQGDAEQLIHRNQFPFPSS